MTEWLSRPARDGGSTRAQAETRVQAGERMPGGERVPAAGRVAGRERMPWTMVLALLISAVSVGAWVAGGLLVIVAPQRALVTGGVLPVWVVGVAAGVVANAAVVVGGIRRRAWTRWIVTMQALVMIVLLSAAEQGGWAVAGTLLLAVQCVLITMPSANDWFAPRLPPRTTSEPAPRTTSERAPGHPG
ncbi:hypothetical protein [uncultured Microbacterium sp.]|uniref:hypothetical protein n=1 Tax=uncultured Microbacterium sp. TaxID=191216 RepID=UPI0028DC3047|nr:hypothetical protein [uncultured Microbacterium sp.]